MERNVGIRGRKMTDGKIGNLKEIEGRRSRRGKVNEWSKGGEGGGGGVNGTWGKGVMLEGEIEPKGRYLTLRGEYININELNKA